MKRYFWLASTAPLLIGLYGCNLLKKREPVEGAASSQASAAPAPAPPPVAEAPAASALASAEASAPVPNDSEIPTPQDFEDEAFEKITAQNFEAELARLDKEIGK
jgi:hypothetical protein